MTPQQERANPPFNVRKLAATMQGSEKSLKLKEKFMAEIARHPAFRNNDIHDLTKDEVRERTAEKFASMVYFFTSESIEAFQERMALISIADPAFWVSYPSDREWQPPDLQRSHCFSDKFADHSRPVSVSTLVSSSAPSARTLPPTSSVSRKHG